METAANNLTCLLIQRIVVPLVLLICALLRPVGISYVYLLMFFISPFVPISTPKNFRGSISAYFIIFISLSVILVLCHTALQIIIITQGYDALIGSKCSFTELLLRHIGFISFVDLGSIDVFKWIVPEIIALITSIASFIFIKKNTLKENTTIESLQNIELDTTDSKKINYNILYKFGPAFSLASLFVAGTLRPSIPGFIFFIVFLASGTYWATFKKLNRGFAKILQFSMFVLVCHIILFISYQTPWPQEAMKNHKLIVDLWTLEPLVKSECKNDIRTYYYNLNYNLDSYLLPIIILISYHILALNVKYLQTLKGESAKESSDGQIPLENLADPIESDIKISWTDQIYYGIKSVAGFVYENSYIFTNVLMMIWSIVFHSWLAFVFLIWANVLWMIPNQRKAMMRSSPLIVFYAEILVIIDYIYAIYITDTSMSKEAPTLNIHQIGLHKPSSIPIGNFLVKTLFILIFWVTLRQTCKESITRKRSIFMDYVANVPSNMENEEDTDIKSKKPSLVLKKSGHVIKHLLVRLWIWLLLIIIFMSGVTGAQMTAFRICYMALFLFFLLAFQISSKAWIKLMYGFWIFLIFYAMSILILIYTYQFDNFNEYWTKYLNMSEGVQDDVGLEKYKTKDLFLHLVAPTAIVILTVIQVHYFHKRLVDSLKVTPIVTTPPNVDINDSTNIDEPETIKRFSNKWLLYKTQQFILKTKNVKELIWLFLELHIMKAIYLTAFLCCITEVNALHIFIAIFSVLGVISSHKVFISRIISIIVSVIILTKMIYQVGYLDHSSYDVVCKNNITIINATLINATSINATPNTAIWFGLQKTNEEINLIHIIKKYIVYMLLVTIHAVVILRQNQIRLLTNSSKSSVLFPKITRKDAENNLKDLIKYLINYGFYKFGLEITFIVLVVLINFRQDITTVLFAIWLGIFIFIDRSVCAKFWTVFEWFTAILIIIQYILFIKLPPTLCIEYIWEDAPYNFGIQLWGLLPGNQNYSHVDKLIFDFILLICISRQKKVFRKEKELLTNMSEYPGGNNKSVIDDIEFLESKPFQNPTKDFITYVRNWLDVYRNAIICGLYWFTLALLFMTGTYRSDILALGYLIGSCIFLWLGTDFYLRPITIILKWWNLLLLYNIIDIIIQILLTFVRYFFLNYLQENSCWFVYLFALSTPTELKVDEKLSCSLPDVQYSTWTTVCFAFLIFQLRIFKSHYFCHIIVDTKANLILASRGAELIRDLRRKQIDYRQKYEQEVLFKIKKKMEKIRSNQQNLNMPEPDTHFRVEDFETTDQSSNISSYHSTGYHTPDIIANEFDEQINDCDGLLLTQNINFQAPSTSSVGMSISVEGYEEPKRLSFGSNLEKNTVDSTMLLSPTSALKFSISGNNDDNSDRRRSSGNTVSWNEPIEKLEKSIDSNISLNDNPDTSNILRQASVNERRNNILNSCHIYDHQFNKVCCRRRFSNISYYRDDKLTKRPKRPYSWGPISNTRHLEPFITNIPEPTTHHQSISAGDYYMFEDMDEQFKLDLIDTDKGSFLEQQEKITNNERKRSASASLPTSISERDITDQETTHKDISLGQNVKIEDYVWIANIKKIITKILTYFRFKMDAFSRNYRYVIKVQSHEKKILKVKSFFHKPTCKEPEGDIQSAVATEEGIITYGFDYEYDKFLTTEHHTFISLLISIWYAIISNTDILCFFAIFVNQMVNASIMSLPLPIMVFLWGTLSLPRPTKTFWVTLIAYTQAIVFIKALFQFKSIWSNYANLSSQPYDVKIVGIETDKSYAVYDLLLLLFLFSHRVVLKSQGLWKTERGEESYTEQENLIVDDDNSENMLPTTSNQNMESASFTSADEREIIHATKANTDVASESAIELKESSNQKEPNLNMPGLTKFTCSKYFSSMRNFFFDLINKSRLPVDVYVVMFLCDFINFFVLLFGFAAFANQSSNTGEGVQKYLQENKVPVPFLIMLFVQFVLIIIDRALYLRKALIKKIVFHFLSVISIHFWMFFVLPAVTELKFNASLPPVIFYIIKCIYFLLSSYQIKCGYPKRILGNFLTRGFKLWNYIAFKVYMLMPFLYELRTLLDWVCTGTTMSLGDWLKMEDIFSSVFLIKCLRQFEADYPTQRGVTKRKLVKLLLGGLFLLVIVILIWGPLSIFAVLNAVGESNIPYKVSASLQIGTYNPIYEASRDSIFQFDEQMMSHLKGTYITDKQAQAFIENYDPSDIAAVIFTLNSPSLWNISPPDKQNLLKDLADKTMVCRFIYTMHRDSPNNLGHEEISSETVFTLKSTFEGHDTLINMIQGNFQTEPVLIPNIFPKFVKVVNSANLNVIPILMLDETPLYRSLFLKIFETDGKIWWQIQENCTDDFYKNILNELPYSDCNSGLVMYTFNDKKFPTTFRLLTGGGIIGLYTTFVLFISKILKTMLTGQHRNIMYEDLPYVDRVLQLCLDVYLVREALEFTLEEDLFAKLIFLYRSPATMIKWTQHVWAQARGDEQKSEPRKKSITISDS